MVTSSATVTRNGNGIAGSVLPWLAIGLSVAGAFWSVANPKAEVLQVKSEMMAEIISVKTDLAKQIASLVKDLDKYVTAKEQSAYALDTINKLNRDGQDIRKLFDSALTRDRYEANLAIQLQRDERLDRDIVNVREVMLSLVRRDDHVKDLEQINLRITGIRDTATAQFTRQEVALTELQRAFSGASTIGDQLKAIQKRQDDLDTYLRTHKPN